jgi:hypothetical protein
MAAACAIRGAHEPSGRSVPERPGAQNGMCGSVAASVVRIGMIKQGELIGKVTGATIIGQL